MQKIRQPSFKWASPNIHYSMGDLWVRGAVVYNLLSVFDLIYQSFTFYVGEAFPGLLAALYFLQEEKEYKAVEKKMLISYIL